MTVTSNIGEVIRNLERLERGLKTLPEKIFGSAALFDFLQSTARTALEGSIRSIIGPDLGGAEEELVNQIVGGLTRTVTSRGVTFSSGVEGELATAPSVNEATDANLGARTESGRIKKSALHVDDTGQRTGGSILDDDENLQQVRAAIEKWVETEKNIDERDAGKSTQEIADDIMFILGVNTNRATAASNADPAVLQAAAEALLPHIQDFIDRASRGEVDGLEHLVRQTISPEQMREWLLAVMTAWRKEVPLFLAERINVELEKIVAGVKGS